MRTILIALLFVATPAFAGQDSKAHNAIKAVFTQIDSCLKKGDAECVGALFAEDATYAGPVDGGKIVKGRAAITKAFASVVRGQSVDQTRTLQKVRLIGEDHAFADCSISIAKEKAGDQGGQDWHNSALLRREGEKWLLEDVRYYVVMTVEAQIPESQKKVSPPTPSVKDPTPANPHQADGKAPAGAGD